MAKHQVFVPEASPAGAARRRGGRWWWRAALVCAILPGLWLAGCARSGRAAAPYPHESVLAVVAELKIYLAQDPYREPPGRDLNGRNIFRVSLSRLDALRELTGERYGDAIDYARGECLERLGEWPGAQQAFTKAADRATSLSAPARRRAGQAGRMASLTDRQHSAMTLDGYLEELSAQDRQLAAWQAEAPPLPYAAYLRQAREQVQAERTRFLFANRLVLEGGAAKALEAAAQLTRDHAQSAHAAEHWLLLGSFHETLARDWTAQHAPESAAFNPAEGWAEWVEQARVAYRHVAQADGDPVKPEGQARLRALDAYAQRVQTAAQ